MTEIEAAELIVKQNGDCDDPVYINCNDCHAYRIRNEKGLFCCGDLWDYDVDKRIEWFENWLSKNGEKMKTEKIKELREKLQNITDEQLETIADIIYDKVVDPEQNIIDAHDERNSRIDYTD